ncbi:MAG: L-threonylcarbamoyladenylate synthase [Gammaproteobacteria bacterium]|nr:L-threonylcarbamoyladenylate synthase [Gammaproteobacteria bacterium]
MSQYFSIHPVNPQLRLVKRAVEMIKQGALVIYPTDSCYAFGCHIGDKDALDRIRRIREVDEKHNFTLVCKDLSELGNYAFVDNTTFRLLRNYTPGPYTFILRASREVPRRMQVPKRKTIGLRIPDHPVALHLLEELGEPLMSSTLILPGDETPMTDPEEMRERLEHKVDLIIDGGNCGIEPTTVVNMEDSSYEILRQGKGEFNLP